MSKGTILVVDDEPDILELVKYNLTKEGYQVVGVASGEEALTEARSNIPDLIILDLMLPGIDGLEVCKVLKGNQRTSHIPIIMLTAKGEDADVVTGLELGADDYIVKPFSPRVLLARIKAVQRRESRQDTVDDEIIKVHNLIINLKRHEVLISGNRADLSSTEFDLLCLLARHPGWVFTRHQIISNIKSDNYAVTDRSVDVQVVGLRKKLKEAGNLIETVHGIGYRFREE